MWTRTLFQQLLHVIAIGDWLTNSQLTMMNTSSPSVFWTDLCSSSWKILWAAAVTCLMFTLVPYSLQSLVVSESLLRYLIACLVVELPEPCREASWCHMSSSKVAKTSAKLFKIQFQEKLLKFLQPIGVSIMSSLSLWLKTEVFTH